MTKRILRAIATAATTCLVLSVYAQESTSQYPTILQQPEDQCLPLGGSVTFSVVATNADTYQWYKNNVAIDGETNSSITLSGLGTNDVAYYGASINNSVGAVPTRSAMLNVYVTSAAASTFTGITHLTRTLSSSILSTMSAFDSGESITVFSLPVASNGGGTGTCPGKYSGYVNYMKPLLQGWGWAPSTGTTTFTMTDTNRTDTKVQYGGQYGDSGCAQTTVTVPYPTMSPVYRFCVYFPQGAQVPTNAYPIVLSGFDP